MPVTLGVLMDPIQSIKPYKDTSFAMMLEAQRRGWRILYLEHGDLAIRENRAIAHLRSITVQDRDSNWFELGSPQWQSLKECDVLLLRKDPPVDPAFVNDTQVADLAQMEGVMVVNSPQALRDANEKLFALHFPQCIPATCVARDPDLLREFINEFRDVVLKPLDGMGGKSIFRARAADPNINVILETLTQEGREFAMAQQYLEAINEGDKRILLIDGIPIDFALARIPQGNEFRGNMARGGLAIAKPLTDRDRWISAQVAPELIRRGIRFAGLDVIGDYLTEVNVTSPTGIRELDKQCGLNIAGVFLDRIEASIR